MIKGKQGSFPCCEDLSEPSMQTSFMKFHMARTMSQTHLATDTFPRSISGDQCSMRYVNSTTLQTTSGITLWSSRV